MLKALLIFIFLRPFISSRAFPLLNAGYFLALLALLALWAIKRGLACGRDKPVRLPGALFTLALVISALNAPDKLAGLGALYQYAAGIILMLACAGLSDNDKGKTISLIAWSGFFVSLLSLFHYQYFFASRGLLSYLAKEKIAAGAYLSDFISRGRAFFPFINPNILAGYLSLVIPLALTQKKKILLTAPMFLALILTQSMGGSLSLFAGLLAYFCLCGRLRKRDLLLLAPAAAMIIVFFALRSHSGGTHTRPAFSSLSRINYWLATWEIIWQHPLLGVGPGNFNLAQSRFAHNSYLQIWAETGICGIIAFFWLAAALLRNSLQKIKASGSGQKIPLAGLSAASIAFLAHNFVDFSFFLPEVSLNWWVILGLSLL